MSTTWPSIETGYRDPEGWIDPDLYEMAGDLWRGGAEKFALSTLRDAETGRQLLLKAAANVTRARAAQEGHIKDLKAYLAQVYKNLILAELKKENGHGQILSEKMGDDASVFMAGSITKDVMPKILIEQLMQRMDDCTREIFELLILGHSFEEIAQLKGKKSNAIRSKFSKQLKRLMKQVTSPS